jgi:hypothetical protein
MAQKQGFTSAGGARPDGTIAHTAVAADFVLGAGWGDSTYVVTSGSTDVRGEIVITAVTGGGLAQATATIVHTYNGGAWAAKPWPKVKCTNDNSLTAAADWTVTQAATTTTASTWTFQVLPVNGKIYTVRYEYTQ